MTDQNTTDQPIEDAPVRISNEFADVTVRKVQTDKGERLEITVPQSGHTIRLDAVLLESLAWQDTESLSVFLEDQPE